MRMAAELTAVAEKGTIMSDKDNLPEDSDAKNVVISMQGLAIAELKDRLAK